MAALRELLLSFTTEADTKPLDNVDDRLKGIQDTAQRTAQFLGLAFGVKAVGDFIVGQIEAGAQLAHTSQMLGMTVGDFQALSYAAQTTGLSTEEASNAIRFLNRNMGEAAAKGGDAGAAFTKLGVHLKDANGNIRPTQDVLSDVADGFQKLPSPAAKTAAAMQLFGRSGAALIPLLNKGSSGIADLGAEFEALGGGIDEEFVEKAEEGEHALVKLQTAGKGLASTIASALLPMFMAGVDWVTQQVVAFRQFSEQSYIVQDALGTLGVVAGILIGIWGVLNFGVLLTAAGIALLILAVDDVYTALKGGNSVIGDFIDDLFGIGAANVVFATLKSWVKQTIAEFQIFGDMLDALDDQVDSLANETAHALHRRSDEEYEATKKQLDTRAETRRQHTLALDDEQTAAEVPSMYDAINANENAYAQQVDPNGPNLPKNKWYHLSGLSARQAPLADQPANDPNGPNLPSPWATPSPSVSVPAPAAAPAVTVQQSNDIRQTITANGSVQDATRAISDGTSQALRDTHEDAFAALPTAGGY